MVLRNEFIERTCKNTIETILLCLECATKGTIYVIGPAPELRAMRITSGSRDHYSGEISWGLPEVSDYNPPGKTWEQYRDYPDQVLEAMGWCVQKQLSWTADNPSEDERSVRRQLFGELEDYYHLEPVLARKEDLYGERIKDVHFPFDWKGRPIWHDTKYVVVAVIKIHFLPETVRRRDRSTQIIKKLSRMLATDLVSNQLRETYLNAQQKLSRERIESCNVMAHELRNTLTKLGFVFSAVNAVMGFLREAWEKELQRAHPFMPDKTAILRRLGDLLVSEHDSLDGTRDLKRLSNKLLIDQEELATLFLLPEQSEKWLDNKIKPKWHMLLSSTELWKSHEREIHNLLDDLEQVMSVAADWDFAQKVDGFPEDLVEKWHKLAYTYFSANNFTLLDDVRQLLEHPALSIPHKQQLKKALSSLKILIDIISRVEESANQMVYALRNGDELGDVE